MFLITERYNCLQILLSKVTMEKGNDELTGATVIFELLEAIKKLSWVFPDLAT